MKWRMGSENPRYFFTIDFILQKSLYGVTKFKLCWVIYSRLTKSFPTSHSRSRCRSCTTCAIRCGLSGLLGKRFDNRACTSHVACAVIRVLEHPHGVICWTNTCHVWCLSIESFVYFGQFYKTTTISTLLSAQQTHQAIRIGQSVRLAAKCTPWDSSCLTQAMVAKFWCRLFNIPYILFIGFSKTSVKPAEYRAHAWLTADRVALTGGYNLAECHVISSYISISYR